MPIDGSTVAPQAPTSTPTPESEDFDRRWAAWRAKGIAHDRVVRRKLAVVAPVLIIVAAAIIYALG